MRRRAWVRWVLGLVVLLPVLIVATGFAYDPEPAPLRWPRRSVVVDGSRVAFRQEGAGPDVVLLHGSMGSAEDFEPVFEALTRGHRVTAVDRPGFGGSQARGDDATLTGNARLLAGLVRAVGLTRPVVVGHSHGGGVALRLAASEPDLVSGLVLIAPATYPDGRYPEPLDRLVALPRLGEGLAAWVGPWLGPGQIRHVLEAAVGPDAAKVPADFITWRTQLWVAPRSLATHARQNVTDNAELAALAPRYPTLAVPAVVIWCDQDAFNGRAVDSGRLARELPQARAVPLTGCGHYVQYARPAAVIAAIEERSPTTP
jgi:pimeloyl-ACP methyl ester carboxylesterase